MPICPTKPSVHALQTRHRLLGEEGQQIKSETLLQAHQEARVFSTSPVFEMRREGGRESQALTCNPSPQERETEE